jgi:hypothetical protein
MMTCILVLADGLLTRDGRVSVRQLSEAVYDNSTGQHHAALTCGKFLYSGTPPFNVTWTVRVLFSFFMPLEYNIIYSIILML